MKSLSAILAFSAALFTQQACALEPASPALHEKRLSPPAGWVKTGPAPQDAPLDLRIALTQNTPENPEELIHRVSHPESKSYGQYFTPQEVIDLFAPTKEAVSDTLSWLVQSGVKSRNISPSAGRNWIKVKTTVREAEKLLHAKYYQYTHFQDGVKLVACDEYSLPANVQKHVDFVAPTIQFETRGIKARKSLTRRDADPAKFKILSHVPQADSLDTCSNVTTPACLRATYGIPENHTISGSSYGIVEFAPQSYNQSDLDGFFAKYAPTVPEGTSPVVAKIDGGYLVNDTGPDTRGESNLDLGIAISLVHPQPVTLYQVGDNSPANPATNNNFLDAIDRSYCTTGGGDDKDWDAIYPHEGYLPDQWMNPPQCGTENATSVISISYGSNEGDRPLGYRQRECMEYMKLGLMGVSVLFSSGDTGVAGLRGVCTADDGRPTPPGASSGRFNLDFPASCPWVTAVGGSALPKNGKVTDKEVVAYDFNPGGGFSDIFALPSYQADAIADYYKKSPPPYDSTRYNNTQKARGYPDLVVASQNFITGLDGGFQTFSGTSASAPTFGAMVALVNGERAAAGKGPVGFLNPTLYAHREIFEDVTEGHNSGCGTQGFEAVEGWDAASGLGTPKFEKLREVLMALP